MSLSYVVLDVFTNQSLAGNPLAVFPQAETVSAETMQSIAGEMNLSETVFVSRHQEGYRFRIFTPQKELDFAGHPVIGTSVALSILGMASGTLKAYLNAGIAEVQISEENKAKGARFRVPRNPEMAGKASIEIVEEVLGLSGRVLGADTWSCGTPFLMVEVKKEEYLSTARIDSAALERLRSSLPVTESYVFFRSKDRIFARMFAPLLGIPEDPATGGAAAAIAGLLSRNLSDGTHERLIHQGREMGRPSEIGLTMKVDSGELSEVWISGNAVLVARGELLL
jgi:trans-2,3-dihydro-3-hydroxyanthranilate isomerase